MGKYRIHAVRDKVHEVEAFDFQEVASLVIFTDHQSNKLFALPVAAVKTIEQTDE